MGHFYLPDGTPLYEVPNKSKPGQMRDATILDAKKVGAYPSVTTIIDLVRKPQLEVWKETQAILSALTYPNLEYLLETAGPEAVIQTLRRDSQQQVRDAAEQGTAVHDAIEAYYKRGICYDDDPHYASVVATAELIHQHCGARVWEAERWFAHPLGFGGKIDLVSDEWILDVKTKPGAADSHKMYPEQLMQLVAYDVGYPRLKGFVSGPTDLLKRKKANVIVSRDIPGSVAFWEWPDTLDMQRKQWRMFCALLSYWQIANEREVDSE